MRSAITVGSLLIFFYLSSQALCQETTLTLEFAQEGDPRQPRALILIHDALEDRGAFANLFEAWSDRDRSWARDQFCSVYSFEYRKHGLQDLPKPEALAQELFQKIQSNNIRFRQADDVNPKPRHFPTDPRQPSPSLRSKKLELLIAGYGYGGLVAREVARLAQTNNIKVTRIGYIGTPLDGLSTVDLILALSISDRALRIGLAKPLDLLGIAQLSEGWWSLVELFYHGEFKTAAVLPAKTEVKVMACYGSASLFEHPTDNVLYGRHRRALRDGLDGDGLFPHPVLWGRRTGPMPWLVETTLEGIHHSDLTEQSAAFILTELIDREITYEYLWRRQQIEEYIRGDGEILPLYIYWDERDTKYVMPQWREAYASRKGLYEMMW